MRYRSGGFGPFDGPEDLWQQAAERDREVLAEAGFPLYAPVSPELEPRALTEYQLTNGRLVKVELCTGDWFSAEGPQVKVTTLTEADPGATEAWASLADLITEERDRLRVASAISGLSGGVTTGVVVEGESGFVVDGALVEGTFRQEGPLWAARLPLPAAEVLLVVTGRGVAPEGVELGVVTDIAPYALGRQHLLNELTLRRERQEKRQTDSGGGPEEPPAPLGLDDHRRLIDFCVADALRIEAQVRAHALPRAAGASGGDRRGLWERAVRQQMRLAGEDRQEADESVTAMVNQMVSLAQAADWFADAAGPEARSAAGSAAVEESIRFTALDSDVRSAPAQRAWLRQWHRLDEPSFPGDPHPTPEESRLRHELTVAARADWLDLWRAWFSGQ